MACRVRVKLIHRDRVVKTSALINSGFETDSPDVVIPVEVAKKLGLWPPKEISFAILDTGGGEVSTPYYESAVELEIVVPDRRVENILLT